MKWFVNGRRMAGKVILILGIAVSGWLVMYYSYKTKQASADGRILIWKVSAGLLAGKPFGGYGYGLFEREYNLAQGQKYFEQVRN